MFTEANRLQTSQWCAFMAGRRHAAAHASLWRARELLRAGFLVAAREAICTARSAHLDYQRWLDIAVKAAP